MRNFICKTSLLLIITFFPGISFSQLSLSDTLRIDSLKRVLQHQKEDSNKVNTLNAISPLYDHNRDTAMYYANKAIILAKKINFNDGEGKANYNYGVALLGSSFFGVQGNLDEVLSYLNNAVTKFNKSGNKQGLADCYYKIGDTYFETKQDGATLMKYCLLALKIYEEIGNKPGIAKCYSYLGSYYYQSNENSPALKNMKTALRIYEDIKDSANITDAKNVIASIYLAEGNVEESLRTYQQVLEVYLKLGNRGVDYGIPYTYGNIGDVHLTIGDSLLRNGDKITAKTEILEALKYYQLRLKLEQEGHMSPRVTYMQMGDCYLTLSKLYTGQEKVQTLKLAKDVINKGMEIAINTNQKGLLEGGYYRLANVDKAAGNYKEAFEHFQLYITYRDSLYNEEDTKKMVTAQMQYEFDKKEAAKKAEQDRKDAKTKFTRSIQYSLMGVFLLIAVFLFLNNRQKQKSKAKIEKAYSELESTQAQLIQSAKMASLGELTAGIAHEIQNPLNFVNNFSEVNKELLEELKDEAAKGNIDEVKDIANDVIENSEKINHHGKRADAIVKGMLQHSQASSGKKEPANINSLADEYLRLAYHGARGKDSSFNVIMKTDFDETIGKINIIPQDIGRVLLNLYNNAFYAVNEKKKIQINGYDPSLSIITKKNGDKVEIRVIDNGNGIPQNIVDKIFQPFFTTKPTGQGTGLGLSLSYDIIKAHRGEIKVETKKGEGSEFIIQLPIV